MLFRTFMAFCVFMNISMYEVELNTILCFLECLSTQGMSVHMLRNYVSAIKAKFIIYDLDHSLLERHKVRYFLKSVHINRPLSVPSHNIMDPQCVSGHSCGICF